MSHPDDTATPTPDDAAVPAAGEAPDPVAATAPDAEPAPDEVEQEDVLPGEGSAILPVPGNRATTGFA